MTIKTLALSAAVVAGMLVCSDRASAQITTGVYGYSTPGGYSTSAYTPAASNSYYSSAAYYTTPYIAGTGLYTTPYYSSSYYYTPYYSAGYYPYYDYYGAYTPYYGRGWRRWGRW